MLFVTMKFTDKAVATEYANECNEGSKRKPIRVADVSESFAKYSSWGTGVWFDNRSDANEFCKKHKGTSFIDFAVGSCQ